MNTRWLKNIGALFPVILLSLFIIACGSSSGLPMAQDGGDPDGNPDGPLIEISCTITESAEATCDDGKDNDCDDLIDGDDRDCQAQNVAAGDSGL